jgi:hypothetical protein
MTCCRSKKWNEGQMRIRSKIPRRTGGFAKVASPGGHDAGARNRIKDK